MIPLSRKLRCGDWYRKLIRISADAPRAGFLYVFAECGLRLRDRIKRPEIGGRNRTFFRLSDRLGFGTSVDVTSM
jgi:hypothetical protein